MDMAFENNCTRPWILHALINNKSQPAVYSHNQEFVNETAVKPAYEYKMSHNQSTDNTNLDWKKGHATYIYQRRFRGKHGYYTMEATSTCMGPTPLSPEIGLATFTS